MADAKIQVRNLYKIFGRRPEAAFGLLKQGRTKDEVFKQTGNVCGVNDVSFDVEEGEIYVLMGLSGSGKSTLIRLINRLVEPTAGAIRIDGVDVASLPQAELLKWRRKHMAMVFQSFALMPHRNVLDNVGFGLDIAGCKRAERDDASMKVLRQVGLDTYASKYPSQLSGGMQRRAELARAMINSPKVMILDEPFRGLDAMSKELMWEYYSGLFEESHRTNFFITTDIDEAIFLADRLIVMTNVPTRVRAVLEVDVPRPRKLTTILESERANEVKMKALSLLHEEAMKSFSGGSKAAADFVEAYSKRSTKGESAHP